MNSLYSSFEKKYSINLEPSTDIDNMNTIAINNDNPVVQTTTKM